MRGKAVSSLLALAVGLVASKDASTAAFIKPKGNVIGGIVDDFFDGPDRRATSGYPRVLPESGYEDLHRPQHGYKPAPGYGHQPKPSKGYGNQYEQPAHEYGNQHQQSSHGYGKQHQQTSHGYGNQHQQTSHGYGNQHQQTSHGYGNQHQPKHVHQGYGNGHSKTNSGYANQNGYAKRVGTYSDTKATESIYPSPYSFQQGAPHHGQGYGHRQGYGRQFQQYPQHHGYGAPHHQQPGYPSAFPVNHVSQQNFNTQHYGAPHHQSPKYGAPHHQSPEYGAPHHQSPEYGAPHPLRQDSEYGLDHYSEPPAQSFPPVEPCSEYSDESGAVLGFKLNPDRLCPVDECNAATQLFLSKTCTQATSFKPPADNTTRMRVLQTAGAAVAGQGHRVNGGSGVNNSGYTSTVDHNGTPRTLLSDPHNPSFCRYDPQYQAVTSFQNDEYISPSSSDILLVKNGLCYNAFFNVKAGDRVFGPSSYEGPHGHVDCNTGGYGEGDIWWVTSCNCSRKPARQECKTCPTNPREFLSSN